MARKPRRSRRITIEITDANRQAAIESNSGGCLIADTLKAAGWLNPTVDMATVRVTDPDTKDRYTYLTTPDAQHVLLSFDQGWPSSGTTRLQFRKPVKITHAIRGRKRSSQRAERLAELEAKERAGELSRTDQAALTRMRNQPDLATRPHTQGPAQVTADGTIIGGHPIAQGPAHPNLLRGRNRIYGAKLADPGKAFNEAVDAALAARSAYPTWSD